MPSVYEIVTQRILDEMKEGRIPWRRPWRTDGPAINYVTRKEYRGINRLLLADANPNQPDWTDANHYKVTVKHDGRQMTLYFSQGYGIKHEPREEDILNCFISDNTDFYDGFEDWAANMGFDEDSRKAERTYNACVRQTEKAKRLLGASFDELMECEML